MAPSDFEEASRVVKIIALPPPNQGNQICSITPHTAKKLLPCRLAGNSVDLI